MSWLILIALGSGLLSAWIIIALLRMRPSRPVKIQMSDIEKYIQQQKSGGFFDIQETESAESKDFLDACYRIISTPK